MAKIESTKEIKVPKNIINQVIGQDEAVNLIKKASLQRRHVLLIGEPGTGKSMLGLALAELLPKEKLQDIISLPNPNDENTPLIKTVKAGTGREEIKKSQLQAKQFFKNQNFLFFILAIAALIAPWWIRSTYKSDLMFTAFFLGGMLFLVGLVFLLNAGPRMFAGTKLQHPKLIVDNYSNKQAPFFDATGAHAGALLGDVLHDPLQTFFTEQWLQRIDNEDIKKIKINSIVCSKLSKYKEKIIRKNNYEAVHLPKNELFVLGEKNGSASPVEVLSCNRYNYDGEMIKLTTSENKELIITPEHKIAIWEKGKIVYVEAKKIKKGDKVAAKDKDIIIDEQDVINTYDKRQQKRCKLYYQYKKLKAQNPTWGYKKLAKAMNEPIHRTRWWHHNGWVPVPIQTVDWLKKRKLLPLKIDNPKLLLIAKVIGATFGDGGIFENLNAIFLSSSELEATQEFGRDLMDIFGYSIDNNMRTIEGGIEGHSFCYQNTNRNIIRFFKTLGSPIGKKTTQELNIPSWIFLKTKIADEFFGSLFGSDIGIPSVHKKGNQLTSLSFGIISTEEFQKNRIDYLETIRRYFNNKDIRTNKICIGPSKEKILFRLDISKKLENVINFQKEIKLLYCTYKNKKLDKAIKEFTKIKKEKYNRLTNRGYGAEHAMKVLNISPRLLYQILNDNLT